MRMNEFTQELVNMLRAEAPTFDIKTEMINKENIGALHGIVFQRKNSKFGAVLYAEDFYDRFKGGECIADIAEGMIDTVLDSEPSGNFPPDLDFDKMQGNITFKLIEAERNTALQEKHPLIHFGCGLCALPYIKLGDDGNGGYYTAKVTYDLVENWGISLDDLKDIVVRNAPQMDAPKFVGMVGALYGDGNNLLDEDSLNGVDGMYVLTNDSGIMGASCFFYPGVKDKIYKLVGGYYVLPSSIHEVLIVPDSAGIKADELKVMVKSANQTVVEGKDILSDNVYHYNGKELEVA